MTGYSEALEYLYSLEQFGIVFGLDNVQWILSLLKEPHRSYSTVHVAGTNGKGSVSAMLSAILRTGGRRTGLYTSPHLISFTERIAVDGSEITEEEVVRLTEVMKEKIDGDNPDRFFTFFDFTTALAFAYFRAKAVDIAVVEVGLGGRLDSTNVIRPLVSIITTVDFDHQDYLGSTIEEIALEKAGIVKEGVPVVTGAGGKALDIIRKTADNLKAPLYVLGKDFDYRMIGEQVMSYKGLNRTLEDVAVPLPGDHQLFNAALALCTAEVLGLAGVRLSEETMKVGISSTKWPGRLEFIEPTPRRPSLLLDGAHNPQGARSLASFLKTHFPESKKFLVFGVMKDKDFPEMLSVLSPLMEQIILTRPGIGRSAPPVDLQPYAPNAVTTESIGEALNRAFDMAGAMDLVIVSGSFYTIGEAKQFLEHTN